MLEHSPCDRFDVDYLSLAGCRQAVNDYRAEAGITAETRQVDWSAVFWQGVSK